MYDTHNKLIFLFLNMFSLETSRGAGTQSVPVNRLVVGSISTRGDEIFINFCIFISSLWCRKESAAMNSTIQHAMPPEIGERSVLTLGSLCLPCCVIQREAEKIFI